MNDMTGYTNLHGDITSDIHLGFLSGCAEMRSADDMRMKQERTKMFLRRLGRIHIQPGACDLA